MAAAALSARLRPQSKQRSCTARTHGWALGRVDTQVVHSSWVLDVVCGRLVVSFPFTTSGVMAATINLVLPRGCQHNAKDSSSDGTPSATARPGGRMLGSVVSDGRVAPGRRRWLVRDKCDTAEDWSGSWAQARSSELKRPHMPHSGGAGHTRSHRAICQLADWPGRGQERSSGVCWPRRLRAPSAKMSSWLTPKSSDKFIRF